MTKCEFEIEGICPILFDRFYNQSEAIGENAGKKVRKVSAAETKKEADKKCYRDEKGFLGVPAVNFKKLIFNGSRMSQQKVGKMSAGQFIRATVFFKPDILLFHPKRKNPDGIDERNGKNANTGQGIMIYRPYLATGWKLNGEMQLYDDRISPEMAKQALEEGGVLSGLCAHRPEFGRFKVNKFEVV